MCTVRHERPSGRFSKSRGLSASVSFLPLPHPLLLIFALAPFFVRAKRRNPCSSLFLRSTETLATQAIKITEESVEETLTVLVVENSIGGTFLRANGLLPISGSYFTYLGDLQDGTRVCIVFRIGIKTGRSNIAM